MISLMHSPGVLHPLAAAPNGPLHLTTSDFITIHVECMAMEEVEAAEGASATSPIHQGLNRLSGTIAMRAGTTAEERGLRWRFVPIQWRCTKIRWS
jgi:hypothetical protein